MSERPRKFKAEPYEWHEIIEIEVIALSNLGAGIAKPNDWVVFIPFALPGEKIRAIFGAGFSMKRAQRAWLNGLRHLRPGDEVILQSPILGRGEARLETTS